MHSFGQRSLIRSPSLIALLLLPLLNVYAAVINEPQLPVISSSHTSPKFSVSRTSDRSWFAKARDSTLRTIWRIPTSSGQTIPQSIHDLSIDKSSSVSARYGGDIVLRFNISSGEEAKAIAEAVNVLFLDVWEFTGKWVDIRLSKGAVPSLLALLPGTLQSAHTPLMHNLAQTIFASYPAPAPLNPAPFNPQGSRPFTHELRQYPEESNIFFRDYQPLSVILPWMRLLRSLFPSHVRLISLGTSYEGRDIPAIRVGVHSTNSEKPGKPRKTILVAGGSHAREWISTSTVNYVAYSFITAYGRDRDTTALLESFDFVFIPTLNPDGYAYTWENDRLWRKSRQQTPLRFCKGLDLDRAFDFQWDASASANGNPCSESFSGENPFEAIEARRFADWARNETAGNNVQFVGFLDLHSYSQQILYPFSYTCSRPPANLEDLEELGIGLAKAIRLIQGESYSIASACEAAAPMSDQTPGSKTKARPDPTDRVRIETGGGSALDWFFHELQVPYAYQIKLRDTGNYGFLLPKEHIVPTGKEIFHAVHYFADFLNGKIGIDGNPNRGMSDEAKLSRLDASADASSRDLRIAGQQNNEDETYPVEWKSSIDLRRRRR